MNKKKFKKQVGEGWVISVWTHRLLLWLQDRMYPKGLIIGHLEFHINGPEKAFEHKNDIITDAL